MNLECYCPQIPCSEFEKFDYQELDLSGKSFYTSKVAMFSHFPVNPELKTAKILNEMEVKGLRAAEPLFVIFEDGVFSGRVLIELKETSQGDSYVTTMKSFKLIGKNFTGPRFLVPKALKQFDTELTARDIVTSQFYFWYHSCKRCEKEKGSRTVIFGRIS